MKKIKFQVIKKTQLLTIVATLMLVVAGYLNYTYNPNDKFDVELTGKIEDNLGDAIFVDSRNVESNVETIVKNIDEETEDMDKDYFIQTKIERTNSYTEQIEIYEDMLENNNLSQTQKDMANEQIIKINNIRNQIIIAENLLKIKGFENCVILVSEASINVIVKVENLGEKQVAQIQNIVMNEFEIEVSQIHITNKA